MPNKGIVSYKENGPKPLSPNLASPGCDAVRFSAHSLNSEPAPTIHVMQLEVFNKREPLALRNDIRKETEAFTFLYLVSFCDELFKALNSNYF